MRKVAFFCTVVSIALIALMGATFGARSATAADPPMPPIDGACDPTYCGGGGCNKVVYVLFMLYQGDPFSSTDTSRLNGCWAYTSPKQLSQSPGWLTCVWDHNFNGTGPNWVYDDTNNVIHSPWPDSDNGNITDCASRAREVGCCYKLTAWNSRTSPTGAIGGFGYELMAWNSGWAPTNPGVSINNYFAEIYTGSCPRDCYLSYWSSAIGRPMMNASAYPGSTTNPDQSELYGEVLRICQAIGGQTYMGIYANTKVNDENGSMIPIIDALNNCTI